MDDLDTADYLIISDRASTDTADLYPSDGPSVGTSSVSIPLTFALDERSRMVISIDPAGPSTSHVLWSGRLDLASGEAFLSNHSMRPLDRVVLRPATYLVVVGHRAEADQEDELLVTFTAA